MPTDSSIKITFSENIDRDKIDAYFTEGYFPVTVETPFYADGSPSYMVDVATFDTTYLEAFKKTVDKMLYGLEENALIWRIVKSTKTYILINSYVRDNVSTARPLTAIPDGTPLRVRFEIPGFSSSNYREIDLWYNEDFNPTDLTLLAEIGITLTGNGQEFTIANDVECKVSFSKPTSATEIYIIEDDYYNDIIAP